jgi:uncharacterized protein YhfF
VRGNGRCKSWLFAAVYSAGDDHTRESWCARSLAVPDHCDVPAAPDPLPPYELGPPRTAMRRRLVDAVLRREKMATASLREMYEPFTSDPLPQAGERFVLLGYSDEACGIIEVMAVDVIALDDVDLQFAIDEGEGHTSTEGRRAEQLRYWAGHGVTGSTLVVCERFRLL